MGGTLIPRKQHHGGFLFRSASGTSFPTQFPASAGASQFTFSTRRSFLPAAAHMMRYAWAQALLTSFRIGSGQRP